MVGRRTITNYGLVFHFTVISKLGFMAYLQKFKNYKNSKITTIGVLSIQGSFEEHKNAVSSLGIETVLVKTKEDFEKIDALILPGGESTTMYSLIKEYDLEKLLIDRIKEGMKVLGTCAGMILLSKNILGLIDIKVDRNAYGRQLDSFKTEIEFQDKNIEAIFIRAPKITSFGSNVEVLAKFEDNPVLLKQGNILVASFHPELTDDRTIYEYFLEEIWYTKS